MADATDDKERPRKPNVGFRVSEDYEEWLEGFVRHLNGNAASTSHLIAMALASYAKEKGYLHPPPRTGE